MTQPHLAALAIQLLRQGVGLPGYLEALQALQLHVQAEIARIGAERMQPLYGGSNNAAIESR